jgi:predicted adenylyl cyclase CyaB
LIYYRRADVAGPKPSEYFISRTADPESLRGLLTAAFGVKGVVRKTRHLYLVGQTRIHLDDVEGLGHFMELEVVLRAGQSAEEGIKIANGLMEKLEIREEYLVKGAYMDLLIKNR